MDYKNHHFTLMISKKMLKIKKAIWSTISFSLLSLFSIVLIIFILYFKDVNKYLSNELDFSNTELSTLKYVNTWQLNSEQCKIEGTLKLLDEFGDYINLNEVIDQTVLIYRFFETFCIACIENDVDILKRLSKDIGVESIIIISDYDTTNKLASFRNYYGIEFKIYSYVDQFPIPIEPKFDKTPYFFVLNPNLRTSFVWITDPGNEYKFPYFQRIRDIFLEKGSIDK